MTYGRMKLFMCFGGAAPVADDEATAAEARRRGKRAGRRNLPLFRWKCFSPGKLQVKKKKKKNRPSSPPPEPTAAEAKKKRGTMDMDDPGGGGVFAAFTASSPSSSSSRLSRSASSLYSCPASSPCTPAHSSSAAVSCSLTVASGALSLAPPARRHAKGTSPAAGAAAVVLCLLLVVLCGRVGATLLTPTALYLFPRRWPAKPRRDDAQDSHECVAEVDTGTRQRNRNRNGN